MQQIINLRIILIIADVELLDTLVLSFNNGGPFFSTALELKFSNYLSIHIAFQTNNIFIYNINDLANCCLDLFLKWKILVN